ncbi:MAG: hypothetical protein KDE53_40380, partial [Caldilineaceae bacterium]|nr:hypothetical protein [Caldilineaceae bacterium]
MPNSALSRTTSTAHLPLSTAETTPTTSAEAQARRAWRMWLVACLFTLLCFLILARLLVYQLFTDADNLFNTRLQLTQSPRGTIVDRDGEILAADRFYYQVVVTANAIKRSEDRQLVANELETRIGIPAAKTWDILVQNADRPYAELAKQIEFETGRQLIDYIAAATEENAVTPLQYIAVRPVPERFYPQDALASHVVGFVQAEHYGLYGLEEYYDTFLQDDGVGLLAQQVSNLGSLAPQVRRFLPSVAGKDLVLSLDRSIQYIIEEELQEAIAKYRAQSGTIIVMEPHTGGILGMANWPTYNPNTRNSENVDVARFLNPAVSALYEPGSIFKVITMAAGL